MFEQERGANPEQSPVDFSRPYIEFDEASDIARVGVRTQLDNDQLRQRYENLKEFNQRLSEQVSAQADSNLYRIDYKKVEAEAGAPAYLDMWLHCTRNDVLCYGQSYVAKFEDKPKRAKIMGVSAVAAAGAVLLATHLAGGNVLRHPEATSPIAAHQNVQTPLPIGQPITTEKPMPTAPPATRGHKPEPKPIPSASPATKPSPSPTKLSRYTIMTYNILQADSHTPDSIHVAGGCDTKHDFGCAKKRASYEARIIQGKAGNPRVDIIGTQETSPRQYQALRARLPGYDGVPVLPKGLKGLNNHRHGGLSIMWNRAKLTKFAQGFFPTINNVSHHITEPWVGLKDKFGHKFYVTSLHFPILHYGGTAAMLKRGVRHTMKWVRLVRHKGTVVVVGDFNDEPNQKTTYCGLTRSGMLQNTYDLSKGLSPKQDCPSARGHRPGFGIDQIYVSPTLGIKGHGWKHMAKNQPATRHGSDHTPVYTTISLPN